MGAQKLIVASVRMPMSVSRGDGGWTVTMSPGGLATALRAVSARRPFTWVGFPGSVPPEERAAVTAEIESVGGAAPVYIEDEHYHGFYEEFSNRVLWPVLHSLPTPRRFSHEAWADYKTVNEQFADAIVNVASPDATVWVHDYQLALVPHLLRRRGFDGPVGFFLHIPFPASETFRTVPVREPILRGILGANLIGFHAYEYLSNFRSAALRILGVESETDKHVLRLPTHSTRLTVLPIGIEPDELAQLADQPEARHQLEVLESRYHGKTVILGVDRLDYTKGLPQKLLAFAELLERNEALRDKVVLIQVAAPSRMNVAEYQELKREMDELVGRINGQFSGIDTTPLVYINHNLPRSELTALYRRADIALVTPIRDGMNLVCLEYIAAREQPGTLVLSEFTGAATCLSGAILINPHNPRQIAEVLERILSGGGPSRAAFEHMKEFVSQNTSSYWAERFLGELDEAFRELAVSAIRLDVGALGDRLSGARSPLLFLDYDGTLQPDARVPRDAAPSPRVVELLRDLARTATVYVISGRSANVLDDWLGDLDIGLVCEHGLATRHPGGQWSQPPVLQDAALEEIVLPLFRNFTQRTPGSRIERKAASIAWHHRGSDPKLGSWRAKELRNLLESELVGHPFTVISGSRIIEVRHVQTTKGHAATALLDLYPGADLVFCAGNDTTDVDMFEAVERSGRQPRIVCQVGTVHTGAEFYVETPEQLHDQLERIIERWTEPPNRDSGTAPAR